jgi:hypothetical protein
LGNKVTKCIVFTISILITCCILLIINNILLGFIYDFYNPRADVEIGSKILSSWVMGIIPTVIFIFAFYINVFYYKRYKYIKYIAILLWLLFIPISYYCYH